MKLTHVLLGTIAPVATFAFCLNEDYEYDPLNITAPEYRRSLSTLRTRQVQNIPVHVHILVSQQPANPPGPTVQGKLDFLNENFRPWGYQFNRRSVDTTVNAEWASSIDAAKNEKMKALRRGKYQALNIFMVEGASSGLCSLPVGGTGPISQNVLDTDGCFVPWGPCTDCATLTHEVGHWMGLLHVFQGGCNDGDGCDDTAPQNGASYASPATPGNLNTCPANNQCNGNGRQNVRNFMDYSGCAQEFTPCQGGRMDSAFNNRRKGRTVG